MNFRTTLLLAVLAVAAVVVVVILQRMGEPVPDDEVKLGTAFVFDGLAVEDVTRIEIQRQDETPRIVLEKTDETWRMVEPVECRADRSQAAGLATSLAKLSYGKAVALSAETARRFGLEPPAVTVRFTAAGKAYDLQVGNEAGLRTDRFTYVRQPGGREAYVVKDTLRASLMEKLGEFRERNLVDWLPFDVAAVSLTRGDVTIRAERTDSRWTIARPVRTRADVARLDDLVAAATSLRAESFVTDAPEDPARYGLDKPRVVVRIEKKSPKTSEGKDDKPAEATPAGAEGEAGADAEKSDANASKSAAAEPEALTITIGNYQNVEKSKVYVWVSNAPTVVTVEESKVRSLEKDLLALRDKHAVPLDSYKTAYLAIDLDGAAVAVEKAGKDGWQIVAPEKAPAEADEVASLLDRLAEVKAKEFKDGVPADSPDYGFDHPHGTITFRQEGETKDTTVLIGRKPGGEELWAIESGTTSAGRLDPADVKPLKTTWLDLHKRSIWNISGGEEIVGLSWTRGGETVTLVREAGGDTPAWKMTAPVAEELDAGKVGKLLDELNPLSAEKFLAQADKRGDHGLDVPSITLSLTSRASGEGAAETVHKLLLAEHEGKLAAMTEGGTLIFSVPRSLLNQLDAPLSKEAWGKFDDEQAHRLGITGPDIDLVFNRLGKDWNATAEDFQTNSMKVNWYLGDLVGTEATKVVAYAATDLAKYGLDQPEWRIDVEGLRLDRTFLISAKGPGADRYATIEGSGRVVVLESSQVSRLTTDKSNFKAPE